MRRGWRIAWMTRPSQVQQTSAAVPTESTILMVFRKQTRWVGAHSASAQNGGVRWQAGSQQRQRYTPSASRIEGMYAWDFGLYCKVFFSYGGLRAHLCAGEMHRSRRSHSLDSYPSRQRRAEGHRGGRCGYVEGGMKIKPRPELANAHQNGMQQ